MKDGIINIYKEKGYTSFDVVAILRKKLKTKKIGHTGTLDPQAEGVLPVCLGKATKAVDYLVDKQKTYLSSMRLGVSTDTQDHTGTILETKEVHCTQKEIKEAILSFIGPYLQLPPMYSAIKINGQRLYDIARTGRTVERTPRNITIYDIYDISIQDTEIFFRVTCSKGTYIRTLCHDIGEKLACGAHMTSLIREKSGDFDIQNSLKINELDPLIMENTLDEHIIEIDKVFLNYIKLIVNNESHKYLYNGNKLIQENFTDSHPWVEGNRYRVYDENDVFIGLYDCLRTEENTLTLKPKTLFI